MSKRKRKATVPTKPARTERDRGHRALRLVPLGVAILTFVAFAPTLANDFVAWDDDKNFLTNPHFRGLGLEQLRWMWTTLHLGHYVPLSWMTLGFDHVVWGMNPTGYHLTNLLLHTANAVLVYFIAIRLFAAADGESAGEAGTRRVLAAGLAALLFSVHPLRVESVAWATERRDVLSAMFFLVSILSYLRWTDGASRRSYAIACATFVCALLSKGTAVTLPALLFVANVYPLRRLGGAAGWWSDGARRVYRELAPFAALSIAAGTLAVVALPRLGQLGPIDKLVVSAYSLAFYVWKTIAPVNLSPLYAMPDPIDRGAARFVVAAVAVTMLCAVAWYFRSRRPAITAAWVGFVVAVFPLLGVVQNGPQIAADRYTYYAAPAIAMLAAAGLVRFARPGVAVGVAALALATLSGLTWRQTRVWHDSGALWARVIRVEPDSPIGRNNWGNLVAGRGQITEAIRHFERAVAVAPRYAEAHNNLGVGLLRIGRTREAVEHFRQALAIEPSYADAQSNWGIAAIQQGDPVGAIAHYRSALAIDPGSADAHTNLGNALTRVGRPAEAVGHYAEAIAIRPDHADAHHNWGVALAREGKLAEAVERFRRAVAIDPNHADAKEYLSRALALQQRNSQAPRSKP